MSQINELEFVITQGRELCCTISSLKQKLFSSYSEFQEFKKPIQERICSLRSIINTHLLNYPNNDQNANLISSLGSVKSILNQLESSINPSQIRGETWVVNYPKLFKKPSSAYANNQSNCIDINLSIFIGSLNILESHLKGNLDYDPRPKPSYSPIA
jgi:hypothetical protein